MLHYIDVLIDYQAKRGDEKMRRDRQIVYELVAECTLLKGLKNRRDFRIPAEEEFTKVSRFSEHISLLRTFS
jgi:hypothetical protein